MEFGELMLGIIKWFVIFMIYMMGIDVAHKIATEHYDNVLAKAYIECVCFGAKFEYPEESTNGGN